MCTQENQMNRINLVLCLPFAAGYHHYSGLRNKLFARLAPCMLGKKGACEAFDWMRQPLAGHTHSKVHRGVNKPL